MGCMLMPAARGHEGGAARQSLGNTTRQRCEAHGPRPGAGSGRGTSRQRVLPAAPACTRCSLATTARFQRAPKQRQRTPQVCAQRLIDLGLVVLHHGCGVVQRRVGAACGVDGAGGAGGAPWRSQQDLVCLGGIAWRSRRRTSIRGDPKPPPAGHSERRTVGVVDHQNGVAVQHVLAYNERPAAVRRIESCAQTLRRE